jgi:hypothetical protein
MKAKAWTVDIFGREVFRKLIDCVHNCSYINNFGSLFKNVLKIFNANTNFTCKMSHFMMSFKFVKAVQENLLTGMVRGWALEGFPFFTFPY